VKGTMRCNKGGVRGFCWTWIGLARHPRFNIKVQSYA